MAERASMPTFVPRTVASFERAATVMARRVAAPVRTLAARALSFADRLVGTWAGTGAAAAGLDGGVRPAMRAATRGGAMPVPRPWYEVERDEDAIWPQQAARAAAMAAAASVPAGATTTATTSSTTPATASAAERGAAIARTAVTAAPDVVARVVERAGAADQTDGVAQGVEARPAAASELRAAEALGLHAPMAPAAPTVVAPVARATTPLARALAHAAWVDAQLRVATTAPAAATTRSAGGLVFVAPADVARPVTREPATREPATREPAMSDTSRTVRDAAAQTPAVAAVPTVAWTAALPDPRLPATMPIAVAQRVAEFVARLVGVQTARDAAPLGTSELAAAPVRRAGSERTFVELAAPASWRPGAAGARVEQLSARIDARAMGAWGEPVPTPAAIEAVPSATAAIEAIPSTTAAAGTIEPTYVAPVEAVGRAVGAARLSQFVQQLVGVQVARATAPLPVQASAAAPASARPTAASARVPERVTLAATTPATTATTATTTATTTTTMTRATTAPSATSAPLAAPAMIATMAPGAIARRAEQLGGAVGVRAASLSIDFVDPARLSLLTGAAPAMPAVAPAEVAAAPAGDTIMPAPRPLFATPAVSAAPSLTLEEWSLVATFPSAATAVQLAGARQSRQWAAPERTMLSAIAAGAATTTTAKVARATTTAPTTNTPMTATAMPTTARTTERAAAPGAEGASAARLPARGGAPAEWVAPTVAPAEVEARLPGGRTPRGSFTWPKVADAPLARAEWMAPAIVAVAEQAKHAAPGTPLWGALPPLVAVAPSLAARNASLDARATATAESGRVEAAPAATSATSATTATTATSALTTRDAAPAAASPRPAGADAPAMTLMTAAATREARAAGRAGTRYEASNDGGEAGEARTAPSMPLTGAASERGAVAVSNVRPATTMPLTTAAPASRRDGAGATSGPAARALELARPFLRLVEGGGITGDGASRTSSAPRFYEQPQPLVAGAPSSDSASRIVEALRSQPAATPSGDDRVSLADLTLIAIASATQQVAASPAGGGPSGASSSAAAPAEAAAADDGHGGGGKSGNPAQEIEELARAAFDELQRLFAMARERSGDHG